MARGENLTEEDRAKGGRRSQGGQSRSSGNKGGRSSSRRGLASASQETRERVAREGGKS